MEDETHDPEISYRRGYEQGAKKVFDAIKHCLPARQSSIVQAWLVEDLHKWRLANLRGESKRDPDGSIVMCQPPTERLSKIGGQTSN
jgi:hypothetical protein